MCYYIYYAKYYDDYRYKKISKAQYQEIASSTERGQQDEMVKSILGLWPSFGKWELRACTYDDREEKSNGAWWL